MHNTEMKLKFKDFDINPPKKDCVCIVSDGVGSYAMALYDSYWKEFKCHDDTLETVADFDCCFAQGIEGIIKYWAEILEVA